MAHEGLVDLAADQPQYFAPFVLAAVVVEEGDQAAYVKRLRDVELMHELGRAEVLQKRAMHKGVTIRSDETEDEVAQPQVIHHRTSRGASLAEMQLLTQIVLDDSGQPRAVYQVPLQTARSGLHVESYATQDFGLFP